MALSNGIFTMKAVNDETNSALFSQLGGLLGVAKRSDGRYHLADLCSAGSINAFARCKPFRYASENFDYDQNNPAPSNAARAAARESVNLGFTTTPLISFTNDGIGHAAYTYDKPRGRAYNEPNRIRDFDGYNHNAAAPIAHNFNNGTEIFIKEESLGVAVNFNNGISGWSATDCVTMQEAVEAQYREYYIGLLINKVGTTTYWLVPSTVKIKDYTNTFVIFLVPDTEGTNGTAFNEGATIWDEMKYWQNEGSEYTFAVVATSMARKEDGTAYENGTFPEPRSLELAYGKDRATMTMGSKLSLVGLTGYLNTTWLATTSQTTTPDSMSNFGIIKPNDNQKLTVRLATPASWQRSNCYINVKITNMYGFVYHNGTNLGTGEVNIGAYATIGAGSVEDEDILGYWTYPNQYWFSYPVSNRWTDLKFEITAYRNSDMVGESVVLGTTTVRFNA